MRHQFEHSVGTYTESVLALASLVSGTAAVARTTKVLIQETICDRG